MFEEYNHLGTFYPHFTYSKKGKFEFHSNLKFALNSIPDLKELDEVAIIELLSKNYILGDRTLIKGVYRSPWMAKPSDNKWEFAQIPTHGYNQQQPEMIASTLFMLLVDELRQYIGNASKVGIFLSGGMDSRMVAGALEYLIKEEKRDVSVCALTWGNSTSRDVVYAKEIAKRLHWEWKNYTVDSNALWNNVQEVAYHGCEFSALHLHAIPQMRADQNFDVIVAGSYGDSVGRAEYAGSRVESVKPIGLGIQNFSYLLRSEVYKMNREMVQNDLTNYHNQFPREKSYQQNELDYQLHYMRRMLNPCFEVFGEKAKFYQCFTRPDIVAFMWGLDPQSRTDIVYFHLQSLFKTKLTDIPWARTGLPYGQKEGIPDKFTRHHHSYSQWVCFDLYERIKSELLSGTLERTEIFNMNSIRFLLKKIKHQQKYTFDYLERLVWLTSLSIMIKHYNLRVNSSRQTFIDITNGKMILPIRFQAKKVFRKMFR